ncbi:MAG: hypothetical protein ACKO96_41575, partial [Flammeovirgaceae bacterium]
MLMILSDRTKGVFFNIGIVKKGNSLIFTTLAFLLFFSPASKSQNPHEIIANYLLAIGGETKWKTLPSRISMEVYKSQDSTNSLTTLFITDYYLQPGNYLYKQVQLEYLGQVTVQAETKSCKWRYSDKGPYLLFYGSEFIDQSKLAFPNLSHLEFLNLKLADQKVYLEDDSLLRIDFLGKNTIKHVFFNKKDALLYKTAYTMNGTNWESYYSNYKESNGYKEPYELIVYANGEKYLEVNTNQINYGSEIDKSIFHPPRPRSKKNDGEVIYLDDKIT